MDKANKAKLLQALAPKTFEHPVEGYGAIHFRQLSVDEVDAIRKQIKARQAKDGGAAEDDPFGLNLVLVSVVDAAGAPIFDASDMPALKKSANGAIDELVGKALEVNGFRKVGDEKKPSSPSGTSE
jgi:hypothetical protein